jgi:hypothetical protein
LFARTEKQPAWEQIVDLADQTLYMAKESGRDGWVGVLGTQPGPAPSPQPGNVADLRRLVSGAHCELVCSFDDPSELMWHEEAKHENTAIA